MHPGIVDVGVERRRGKHRQLLRGVQALHVESGIGFGVAKALGFGEGGGEILAIVFHRREDVVGSAVDNAGQQVPPVRREAGVQRLHDGNAAGHGCLVANRQAFGRRQGEQRVAACSQERFVGRNHRAPGPQTGFHQSAGGVFATDQLHHHIHGALRQTRQVRAERRAAQVNVRFGCAAGDVRQRYPPPSTRRDGVAVPRQQPHHACAHRAKAGQADPQCRRSHGSKRAA